MKELHQINEILCAENAIGRWSWESGNLARSSSTVPWEQELINTTPQNYLWERDSSTLLTVEAGIYQVSLAFFDCRKPSLSLLINGECILSADTGMINGSTSSLHSSK